MSHYKKQSVLEVKLFEFSLFGVNTYFVWDTLSKEAAVIDPAMSDPRECEVFSSFVTEQGLILKYLLCTHLHIDHTFGIEYIEANYKIGLHASEADDFFGKQRATQARMFRLRMAEPAPLHIDFAITEVEKFYLGKEYLEAIVTPGHSPGGVSFYCPDSSIVFTGDSLFKGSIGRTDLAGGNHSQLIRSVTSKLLNLPPQTIVYPGHGPKTTIAYEKDYNPYL